MHLMTKKCSKGVNSNKLALGSAQFGLNYGIANQGGKVCTDVLESILAEAWRQGVNTIDTAIAYGDSEERLGDAGVADWSLVSKLPVLPETEKDVSAWVLGQVEGSLKRLNVSRLYGLLLHRPEQLLGRQGTEISRALEEIKARGIVSKIGVSVYEPDDLQKLLNSCNFDLVQAPFNVLDQRIVNTGWAAKLNELDIELHTRSCFLQGLLLIPSSKRPEKFNRWKSLWDQFDAWVHKSRLSPLQACLQFVLSVPEVSKVVIGVDTVAHLQEILVASDTGAPSCAYPQWDMQPAPELLNPARWSEL